MPVVETTNHHVNKYLWNSLGGTSSSDYNENDAIGENPNAFMDSLVFSDEETSNDSCSNVSNN